MNWITAGFGNSEAINIVLSKDKSGYGELILSQEDLVFIDSLAAMADKAMTKDSMAVTGIVETSNIRSTTRAYLNHARSFT